MPGTSGVFTSLYETFLDNDGPSLSELRFVGHNCLPFVVCLSNNPWCVECANLSWKAKLWSNPTGRTFSGRHVLNTLVLNRFGAGYRLRPHTDKFDRGRANVFRRV